MIQIRHLSMNHRLEDLNSCNQSETIFQRFKIVLQLKLSQFGKNPLLRMNSLKKTSWLCLLWAVVDKISLTKVALITARHTLNQCRTAMYLHNQEMPHCTFTTHPAMILWQTQLLIHKLLTMPIKDLTRTSF